MRFLMILLCASLCWGSQGLMAQASSKKLRPLRNYKLTPPTQRHATPVPTQVETNGPSRHTRSTLKRRRNKNVGPRRRQAPQANLTDRGHYDAHHRPRNGETWK